ncbi:MAG: hypothetical protein GF408_02440 [Candidatus Omnitrophica bacterium]|nr:hypothetical protein [Candidatus Omnitrophota bacterium]
MLIGKKGYYYIKTILLFASSRSGSLSIKDVSQRLDISEKVMEQVLLGLKKAGYLKSKRGPRGGYRLSGDVGNETVLAILEKTNQKLEVMSADTEGSGNPIDIVLSDVMRSVHKKICGSLLCISVKDLKSRLNEEISRNEFNYII